MSTWRSRNPRGVGHRILRWLRDAIWLVLRLHGRVSFSQEGEDMVLRRIFADRRRGLYVDIGAHHPMRFSNTYHFYRRGWSGVNIDASPGSMGRFRLLRRRDTNLELAIGSERGARTFHMYSEPAFNGFAGASPETIVPESVQLLRAVDVEVHPLRDVLCEHVPPESTIDFMSIDVEGHELSVLQTGDWSRHRPRVLVVEILHFRPQDLTGSEIVRFLEEHDYLPFAMGVHSVFFADREFAATHPALSGRSN